VNPRKSQIRSVQYDLFQESNLEHVLKENCKWVRSRSIGELKPTESLVIEDPVYPNLNTEADADPDPEPDIASTVDDQDYKLSTEADFEAEERQHEE